LTELSQNFFIFVVFISLELRECRNNTVWMLLQQMLSQKIEILERALNDPRLSLSKFGRLDSEYWIWLRRESLE
jgi:hypothetical protein